jgi:hypothetical protein
MVHGAEYVFRVIEFSGRYDFIYLVFYFIFYSLLLNFSVVCLKGTETHNAAKL